MHNYNLNETILTPLATYIMKPLAVKFGRFAGACIAGKIGFQLVGLGEAKKVFDPHTFNVRTGGMMDLLHLQDLN